MEKIDLDGEIAITLKAILELEETGQYGAMELAEADLICLRREK